MTHKEQLDLWVEGHPKHNQETDECCPDFSCCNSALLAPRETREEFRAAFLREDEALTMQLLMGFLSALCATQAGKVHIAGRDEES